MTSNEITGLIRKIGNAVAIGFGSDYRCEPHYEFAVIIRKASDPKWGIFLCLREPKIEISGIYPKDNDGSNEYHLKYQPSINVSMTRDPASMVADIKRRFLPEYDGVYADCYAMMVKRNEYMAKRDIMAAKFASLTNGTILPSKDRINVPYRDAKAGASITDLYINANNNDVRMDLRNVPADIAEKIIKLLG